MIKLKFTVGKRVILSMPIRNKTQGQYKSNQMAIALEYSTSALIIMRTHCNSGWIVIVSTVCRFVSLKFASVFRLLNENTTFDFPRRSIAGNLFADRNRECGGSRYDHIPRCVYCCTGCVSGAHTRVFDSDPRASAVSSGADAGNGNHGRIVFVCRGCVVANAGIFHRYRWFHIPDTAVAATDYS